MKDMQHISDEYNFLPNYADVLGTRMHYVDQGDGPTFLFLHGSPTWSYIWRNVIPHLSGQGRCVAPDLVGMGRSDKPDIEHTFEAHIAYLDAFIAELGLTDIVLVVQDWGSALGFQYAQRNPDNVRGIAFMEALLGPIGSWDDFDPGFRDIFKLFRDPIEGRELIINQNVFLEQILPGAVVRTLSSTELESYKAPFVDPADREPLFAWPSELPIENQPAGPAKIMTSYREWLLGSDLPKLLLHATPGSLTTADVVAWAEAELPNLTTVHLGAGIHHLQEDHPHAIGRAIAEWARAL
jgi:haloalkane dehalogenase